MKVRNIVFSGFMASIMMIGAASAATEAEINVAKTTLATKSYVDGAYTSATGYTDSKIGTLGNDGDGQAYTNVKAYVDDKITAVGGDTTQLDARLDTLEGAVTTEGSVKYAVKQLQGETTSTVEDVEDKIGALSTTANYAKTGTVAGDLGALDTQVKSNADKIGTATLTTTKQNVSEAINELDAETGTLTSLTTGQKDTLVAAINEVDAHADANAAAIGTVNNLSGAAAGKTNLVEAINTKQDALTISDGLENSNGTVTVKAADASISVTSAGVSLGYALADTFNAGALVPVVSE